MYSNLILVSSVRNICLLCVSGVATVYYEGNDLNIQSLYFK